MLLSATWYPFLFDTSSPMDFLRSVAFWATIALAIGLVVGGFCVKAEKRSKYLKGALVFAVIYACALGVAFLVMSFLEDGIVAILFWPLLVLLIAVAFGAALVGVKPGKNTKIAAFVLVVAALVAALVCMGIYYSSGEAEDYNGVEITMSENIAMILSVVVLALIIGAIVAVCGKGEKKEFDSKSIAYAGVCIAMSFALSYIRIVKMPQGGSITAASLLPLMIYSYLFGVRKGVLAGLIYGFLQALQDTYIVHPMQFLLDYPVAFAGIGTAGLLRNCKKLENLPQVKFCLGAVVAGVLRFCSHVLSGVYAFSEYAGQTVIDPTTGEEIWEAMNPWVYTLSYNSIILIDAAIVVVIGTIVFSTAAFARTAERVKA